MPMFMDRHAASDDGSFSAEDVMKAHELDLAIQKRYGVSYHTAFVDLARQRIFCLVEGPSREACEEVHREAHGMMADKIIEVNPALIEEFFGEMEVMTSGDLKFEGTLRTILFTDMHGSTELYQRLGDSGAVKVRREHDEIVREALKSSGGREIKHTGDGLMACFPSVVRAAECSLRVQAAVTERAESEDWPIRVRIGLSAGEPVTEGDDLFGAAVNLAARVCAAAEPGTTFASRTVRDLALGKSLTWEEIGPRELKGFTEPIHLYRLLSGASAVA